MPLWEVTANGNIVPSQTGSFGGQDSLFWSTLRSVNAGNDCTSVAERIQITSELAFRSSVHHKLDYACPLSLFHQRVNALYAVAV